MSDAKNKGKIDVPKDFKEQLEVKTNIKMRVIVIAEDKVKLYLKDYEESVSRRSDWIAPAGMLASFVLGLATCDFKEAFGMSAGALQAFFVMASVLCAIWLTRCLYNLFKGEAEQDMDQVIQKMKGDFQQPPPVNVLTLEHDEDEG